MKMINTEHKKSNSKTRESIKPAIAKKWREVRTNVSKNKVSNQKNKKI